MESWSELVENTSEALILCRVNPDEPTEILEVEAINFKARELLAWTATPPTLTSLLTSTSFVDLLTLARSSGSLVSGLLPPALDAPTAHPLHYAIKSLKDHVLIRLENGNVPLLLAMGEHLQQNLLIRLVIFESVRNEAGDLENLRLIYKNRAAEENESLQVSINPGELLTDWYPLAKETGLFPQFRQVIETGVPLITERFYPELSEGYEMYASKNGDGIIISYYNSVEKRQARRLLVDWQKIINSSEDAIVLLTPVRDEQQQIHDFTVELINQAAIRLSQLPHGDLLNASLSQLSSFASSRIASYGDVVETGIPYRTNHIVETEAGTLYLDVSATRLNGRLLVVAKDITAYQRVIQDLERQQNLLDGIINSSENLMFMAKGIRDSTDQLIDLTIVKDNQRASVAFETLLGGRIVGQSPQVVFGKEQGLFHISLGVMESGRAVTIEQQFEERTGRWYRIFFRKVDEYLVVTYADITEIQEARLEAEQRNRLLSAVMENSLDGVFAMEAVRNTEGAIVDFTIRLANKLALKITMIPTEKLVGSTLSGLFPQVLENGFLVELCRSAQVGVSLCKESCFYTGTRETFRWFELSMTPATPDLYVFSFKDITELVGWRKEQERLLNELKRSNKSLEQFAYIASHDLQEPARKIKAFGGLIMKQYSDKLPAAGQDMLNRMVSASERMQGMIDSLLMYSRFTNQPRQFTRVSLQHLVEQVLTDLDISIREIDARIRVGELPNITGNETLLYQLFLNLINNALKFIDKSRPTEIDISAGMATEQERTELGLNPDMAWQAIRIADNGIGFDESNRNRIFELFRRLHGQSEYSGSGMGLAICKVVAEQHGGGITVYSTPGAGATFVVLLPVLTS